MTENAYHLTTSEQVEDGWRFVCATCGYTATYRILPDGTHTLEVKLGDPLALHSTYTPTDQTITLHIEHDEGERDDAPLPPPFQAWWNRRKGGTP